MKTARLNLEKYAMPVLVIGAILTVISFFFMYTGDHEHQRGAMASYLFSWVFWFSITLGSFGLSVLYHLLRAKWVLPVLRIMEVAGGGPMLLIMGLLLLPMIIPVIQGNDILYDWANAALRAKDLVLHHKENYLNPSFFGIRYVIYFATWIGLAMWFKNSTRKQEMNDDQTQVAKRNNLSGPAFIWFILTITFALTDWVMSLDSHWSSTMYGLWSGVSMCIGGFAFAVMIFCWNSDKEPYKLVINQRLTMDLGNILFVLTMLWGYTSLSQYLIIWSGNLPDTNFYYIERSKLSWNLLGFVAVVGQFFLPFVMLLTPRNIKIPANLGKVALFMLLIHIVDIYQYVIPAIRHTGPMPVWTDGLAFVSIGMLWVGLVGTLLQKEQLIPAFDNRLIQGGQGAH